MGNPAKTTIIATCPVGAAPSISVCPGSYVRMGKKKLMMSVTINLSASLDAAIKTLANARPLWTVSRSAKVTRIAQVDAVRLTIVQPLPHVTLEER